jgi:DNA-binding NarL/FixJ family response regulator
MDMEAIRVLVVDDHPMFCNGLHALLDSLPEMEWVGQASSGEKAVELALQLQPDVVLMDIRLPELNGIDATREILSASPHIGVLMLTMYEDDDMVFAAMQAGARGYLLKGSDQEEIVRAIKAVGSGEGIFSPGIARRLVNYFSQPVAHGLPPMAFPELTTREREILDLIAAGYNNSEIAQRLVLSGKTVRNHVSNILSKLQVADRAHAIIRAREAGLGTVE